MFKLIVYILLTPSLDTPKLNSLMAYLEAGGFNRNTHLIPYQDSDLSPFSIGRHTAQFLEKINYGLILGQSANHYFHEVTIPLYLEKAKVGSEVPFLREAFQADEIEPDNQFAARHAFVVFAWSHETVTSRFLPMGFSRRGMLAAPTTQEEYLRRIDDLISYLDKASTQQNRVSIKRPLDSTLVLQATAFFKTAGILKMDKLPNAEKEQFESILGDTPVDL